MRRETGAIGKGVDCIPSRPGLPHREGPGSGLIRVRLPSGHDSGRQQHACSPLRLPGPSMIRSGAALGVPPTVGRIGPWVLCSADELRGGTLEGGMCRCAYARGAMRLPQVRPHSRSRLPPVAAAAAAAARRTGTSSGSNTYGLQGLNPGSGTPTKGGTLNMLGQGDVDFMDYNVSYYTIGALGQRPWLRLLYAYPATPGKVTTVQPRPRHRAADHLQRRQDVHGDDPRPARCGTPARPARSRRLTRCSASSGTATRPSRSAACRTSRR